MTVIQLILQKLECDVVKVSNGCWSQMADIKFVNLIINNQLENVKNCYYKCKS